MNNKTKDVNIHVSSTIIRTSADSNMNHLSCRSCCHATDMGFPDDFLTKSHTTKWRALADTEQRFEGGERGRHSEASQQQYWNGYPSELSEPGKHPPGLGMESPRPEGRFCLMRSICGRANLYCVLLRLFSIQLRGIAVHVCAHAEVSKVEDEEEEEMMKKITETPNNSRTNTSDNSKQKL